MSLLFFIVTNAPHPVRGSEISTFFMVNVSKKNVRKEIYSLKYGKISRKQSSITRILTKIVGQLVELVAKAKKYTNRLGIMAGIKLVE